MNCIEIIPHLVQSVIEMGRSKCEERTTGGGGAEAERCRPLDQRASRLSCSGSSSQSWPSVLVSGGVYQTYGTKNQAKWLLKNKFLDFT